MSFLTSLQHNLEVVFGLKPDSNLHRALDANAYMSPLDILMETDNFINELKYPDDKKKNVPLEKGYCAMLRIFKQFVAYHQSQGLTITKDDDWKAFTKVQYDDFRFDYGTNPIPLAVSSNPALPATTSSLTVRPSSVVDFVRDFKRGIKRDVSQFPPLKDEANWDNWN